MLILKTTRRSRKESLDGKSKEVDSYLTSKLHGVIPGALVTVHLTGGRDNKFPDRPAREWRLEIPGQEDVVLGHYLNSARLAVKQYRQKVLAEQFLESERV